ncbi:MAG: hypothetical protein ABI333_09090 [bacterium]
MRFQRLGPLLLAALLGGCPKSQPQTPGRVSSQVLLRDIQRLGTQLQRAGVPGPAQLLEAYLAHYRGQAEQRDRALCAWLRQNGLTPTAATAKLSTLDPPSKPRMRGFLAALLTPRTCRAPRPRPGPAGPVPGIYTFNETKTSLSGDTLAVQERWLVLRKDNQLHGWYLRRQGRQSGDGRRFECSRSTRYGTLTAYTFRGVRSGAAAQLEETAAFVQPGPCAPKKLRLARCAVRSLHAGLQLQCPDSRQLKRVGGVPAPGKGGGVYRWESTTPRPDGGKQHVQESWHLVERMGRLNGFYTRLTTATARSGKSFSCNAKPGYGLARLYLIGGTIKAGSVTLQELAALHRPSPCDDGKVKLDSYRGTLGPDHITLSWGQGSQKLQRRPLETNLALPLEVVSKLSESPPGR